MTRVKVCGVTRRDDALLAADLGASAIGFVFWPGSPRCIEAECAREIIEALPESIVAVGVFVDQPIADVRQIAVAAGLGAVQLHGSESAAFASELMHPVIKAVAVTADFRPEVLDSIAPEITVLLDAHDPVRRGGTGRTIDWSRAAEAARRRPVMLSGGLAPDNVARAVADVRPYGIDLSSGIESAPGIKDPVKMRSLFSVLESLKAPAWR